MFLGWPNSPPKFGKYKIIKMLQKIRNLLIAKLKRALQRNNKMRTKKKQDEPRPKRLFNSFFFITPLFSDTCKYNENKSWRRCRLYFRCRMQCWWIFDFETDNILFFIFEKTSNMQLRQKVTKSTVASNKFWPLRSFFDVIENAPL
jgi:hypothetical protein